MYQQVDRHGHGHQSDVYRGVHLDSSTGTYEARLMRNKLGTVLRLRGFSDPASAARAFDRAAISLAFMRPKAPDLNFPAADYEGEVLPDVAGLPIGDIRAIMEVSFSGPHSSLCCQRRYDSGGSSGATGNAERRAQAQRQPGKGAASVDQHQQRSAGRLQFAGGSQLRQQWSAAAAPRTLMAPRRPQLPSTGSLTRSDGCSGGQLPALPGVLPAGAGRQEPVTAVAGPARCCSMPPHEGMACASGTAPGASWRSPAAASSDTGAAAASAPPALMRPAGVVQVDVPKLLAQQHQQQQQQQQQLIAQQQQLIAQLQQVIQQQHCTMPLVQPLAPSGRLTGELLACAGAAAAGDLAGAGAVQAGLHQLQLRVQAIARCLKQLVLDMAAGPGDSSPAAPGTSSSQVDLADAGTGASQAHAGGIVQMRPALLALQVCHTHHMQCEELLRSMLGALDAPHPDVLAFQDHFTRLQTALKALSDSLCVCCKSVMAASSQAAAGAPDPKTAATSSGTEAVVMTAWVNRLSVSLSTAADHVVAARKLLQGQLGSMASS